MIHTYQSFDEFYPYYLSQHSNRTCRRLHFIGTLLAFIQLVFTIFISFSVFHLIMVPLIGYGFSWTGHFFF